MTTATRTTNRRSRRRYARVALWTLVAMFSLAALLPLTGYLYVGIQDAMAQSVQDTNPRSNMWRAVREGSVGYSAVQGPESGVLIQDGHNWRQLRNGVIANYGGWFLFLVLIAIMLFFSMRGSVPLEKGRSGVKIKRWHGIERFLHWYTAVLFIIMAITGLSLLFGRAVLIPLMGSKGFAVWAEIAMGLHNNLGVPFAVGVLLMIVLWMRHNIPNATDVKWFTTGGGLVGKGHPDAGFMNGGEKVWFWLICTVGVAVIVTGLIMNFPFFGADRADMQLSNLIHGATSLIWIGAWFGHAYIGTIGSEGSLEGMTTGYVDENWAEQHHNLWAEDAEKSDASSASAGAGDARSSPA